MCFDLSIQEKTLIQLIVCFMLLQSVTYPSWPFGVGIKPCVSLMCLATSVSMAVPMFSVSQYVDYVKAGRAFERKLEQVEILTCPLIGETLFHQVLQERLDADGLVLPTIYNYFNEFCRLVQFLDACFISGCMKSTGDRVYRLFASPYFKSDPFVEYWIHGHPALCVHVLLFWSVRNDSSTE